MPTDNAGEARLTVVPDVSNFKRKLDADMSKLRLDLTLNVTADTAQARAEIERFRDEQQRNGITLGVDVALGRAQAQMDAWRTRQRAEGLTIVVDADTGPARMRLEALAKQIPGAGLACACPPAPYAPAPGGAPALQKPHSEVAPAVQQLPPASPTKASPAPLVAPDFTRLKDAMDAVIASDPKPAKKADGLMDSLNTALDWYQKSKNITSELSEYTSLLGDLGGDNSSPKGQSSGGGSTGGNKGGGGLLSALGKLGDPRLMKGIDLVAAGAGAAHSENGWGQILGILTSAGGGAVAGSVFGPWGAGVGALVGGGSALIAREFGENDRENQRIQESAAKYQLQVDRARSAAQGTESGQHSLNDSLLASGGNIDIGALTSVDQLLAQMPNSLSGRGYDTARVKSIVGSIQPGSPAMHGMSEGQFTSILGRGGPVADALISGLRSQGGDAALAAQELVPIRKDIDEARQRGAVAGPVLQQLAANRGIDPLTARAELYTVADAVPKNAPINMETTQNAQALYDLLKDLNVEVATNNEKNIVIKAPMLQSTIDGLHALGVEVKANQDSTVSIDVNHWQVADVTGQLGSTMKQLKGLWADPMSPPDPGAKSSWGGTPKPTDPGLASYPGLNQKTRDMLLPAGGPEDALGNTVMRLYPWVPGAAQSIPGMSAAPSSGPSQPSAPQGSFSPSKVPIRPHAQGGIAGRTVAGRLWGPGTGTSDSILGVDADGIPTAFVSAGEGIVKYSAMQRPGVANLVARLNGFSDGTDQNGVLPPGGPAPVAPAPDQFAGGVQAAIDSFVAGLATALNVNQGLINFGQHPAASGDGTATDAVPSIADRFAKTPGLFGLLGSLNSSDPASNLVNWGKQTGSWLGKFTAKTAGGFGMTLLQGVLGFFGLENSALSPSNPWFQNAAQAISGPLGALGANNSYASGGPTPPGSTTAYPSILHGDEYVISARGRARVSDSFLHALNSGQVDSSMVPHFFRGTYSPNNVPMSLPVKPTPPVRPIPAITAAPPSPQPAPQVNAPPAPAIPAPAPAPVAPTAPPVGDIGSAATPAPTLPVFTTPVAPAPASGSGDGYNHNLAAINTGIASGAAVAGNLISTAMSASSMGAGGAGALGGLSSYAAGLAQQGGKILTDVVNVGSSFLVGSVPGSFGTQDNAYGETLRPPQRVPQTAEYRGGSRVYNIQAGYTIPDLMDAIHLKEAQDSQAQLAQWSNA